MGGNDKLTPFSELAWNDTVNSQAISTVSPQPRVVYPILLIYDISRARMHGWRNPNTPGATNRDRGREAKRRIAAGR
jgi:hypothetical protein